MTELSLEKLGLSESTIRKYRREGQAPRPVMYALFWETPWGRATADANAINDARFAHMRSMTLERKTRFFGSRSRLLKSVFPKGCRSLPIRNFSGWARDEIRKANGLCSSSCDLVLSGLSCPVSASLSAEGRRLCLSLGYPIHSVIPAYFTGTLPILH